MAVQCCCCWVELTEVWVKWSKCFQRKNLRSFKIPRIHLREIEKNKFFQQTTLSCHNQVKSAFLILDTNPSFSGGWFWKRCLVQCQDMWLIKWIKISQETLFIFCKYWKFGTSIRSLAVPIFDFDSQTQVQREIQKQIFEFLV